MKELDRRVARLERVASSRGVERADPEGLRLALEGYAESMSVSVDELSSLSERFLANDRRAELRDERTRPDRRATLFLEGLANAKASRAKVYRGGQGALR